MVKENRYFSKVLNYQFECLLYWDMTLNTCLPRTLKAKVEEGLLSGQHRKPGNFQTCLCSITNLLLASNARQSSS